MASRAARLPPDWVCQNVISVGLSKFTVVPATVAATVGCAAGAIVGAAAGALVGSAFAAAVGAAAGAASPPHAARNAAKPLTPPMRAIIVRRETAIVGTSFSLSSRVSRAGLRTRAGHASA